MRLFKQSEMKQPGKKEFIDKWKTAFKPIGRPGAATGNSIAVEIDGIVYDTLKEASQATGKTIAWVKKNGKLL